MKTPLVILSRDNMLRYAYKEKDILKSNVLDMLLYKK
jgi:hypothetical protein